MKWPCRDVGTRQRPVMIFPDFTGCRNGETLSLRRNQVDLDSREVWLQPGKTENGQGRKVASTTTRQWVLATSRALEITLKCDGTKSQRDQLGSFAKPAASITSIRS